jgi:hypothetical protein
MSEVPLYKSLLEHSLGGGACMAALLVVIDVSLSGAQGLLESKDTHRP